METAELKKKSPNQGDSKVLPLLGVWKQQNMRILTFTTYLMDLSKNITLYKLLSRKGSCQKHPEGGSPSISRPSATKSWSPQDFLWQLYTPPKMTWDSLDPP